MLPFDRLTRSRSIPGSRHTTWHAVGRSSLVLLAGAALAASAAPFPPGAAGLLAQAPAVAPDAAATAAGLTPVAAAPEGWEALSARAEITRTTRGIPHIRAEDPGAAGFALGWVQMEDYGIRVVDLLVAARGETARHRGPGEEDARVLADLRAKRTLRQAEAAFPALPADLRAIYDGFAAAVNRWIELHPNDAPPAVRPDFEGFHVLARDIPGPNWGMGERFARRVEAEARTPAGAAPAGARGHAPATRAAAGTGPGAEIRDGVAAVEPAARGASLEEMDADALLPGYEAGSNTWALAPERTTSGHAILMRNPHLAWTAGYHEAHLVIEGDLGFYGDFRIGGPFGVIGGWNARLGWSTTNNGPELSDLYTLTLDLERGDHVRWEGGSVPLQVHRYDVEVWNGRSLEVRTLEIAESPLGPVVARTPDAVHVVRTAGDGEPRLGEQFLAMMRAHDLESWLEAMRMQARTQSNFTYADADGNIFYVWNAMHPVRPHAFGADSVAHPVAGASDAWQEILAFDALPQLLNPPGGYLRNENDPFHHTNLNAVLDAGDYPPEAEAPRVRLRSQASLEILHGDRRFSLEEVVREKGTERMLLAERVMDDLVDALRAARGGEGWTPEHDAALRTLEAWDRTVAVEARGAVLFTEWWERYLEGAGRAPASAASVGFAAPAERLFREVWNADAPMTTPRGLADGTRAASAFLDAVPATRERWGSVDVAWGEIHRARHGTLDLPVSGCDGLLGCFRVIWFSDDADGRRRVRGGDGWVSAVEFGPEPRAFTVLAYGQSSRPSSPFHQDQLEDFVAHRMTPVAWSRTAIEAAALDRYRPGMERFGGAGR